MKRAFAFLLSTLCVMSMLAYDFQSGGLYYNITSSATVEVTKGDVNYSDEVVIPISVTYNDITYAVTRIGESAFEGSHAYDVVMPNNITSIGNKAFQFSRLQILKIPSSVTSIGEQVFKSCSFLEFIEVDNSNPIYDSRDNCSAIIETATNTLIVGCQNTTIPNSVTRIGDDAFHYCNYLKSIVIPEGVTSIGRYAFKGCEYLTSITIPNSVTSIGESAFDFCHSLTSLTIGNSVTSIGESTFRQCSSLTSVVIPGSVTTIGKWAFSNCSKLTSISIPNSVTSIGNRAFSRCSSLTSLTIPNSVTSIGEGAFSDCSSLTSVTIPNSVTSIGRYAFHNCSSLTSVTIPNSVTSIGYWAFRGCSSLTSVTIPNSVTSIGGSAFESTGIFNDNSNWENGVLYISNCLVAAKESLSGVYTIKNGTRIIADYAFRDCSSLTSVTIPNSVTSIGSSAFGYCYRLTSITIPESVTSIGDWAFENCSSLNTIYVGATTPPELGTSTFAGTPSPLCYIPCGTKAAYEASAWASQVSEFVEDCDNGSYSRNVRIGYNTICLPHGSSHFTGATFYEIAHILKNKKKIFFDEVKTLEAGKPYIFYPHSNEVTVYYDNTTSAIPLSHNGLHGTFDGITAASNLLKGKYLVVGNSIVLCGNGCSLAANRAYIELDEIPDKEKPAIPGIKRVSLDYSEENATTALDNITDESIVAPMQESIYDILGRKVDAPIVSGFYIINGKKVFVAL